MTALAAAPAVELEPVRHGLVDPAGTSHDLDDVLEAARTAERHGIASVVVPADDRYWPSSAQALAVLLATSSVRVVLPVHANATDVEPLARFAHSATRLAGDRLIVRVDGAGAERVAAGLRHLWDGPVRSVP